MNAVNIRAANPADAAAVKTLLAAGGMDLPVAFDDIEGYWLVAERSGRVIGCLQICYGRPIGCLEMLAIDDKAGQARGVAIRELMLTGMAVLAKNGSKFVRGFVPFAHKKYKRVLKSHGVQVADQGNLMLRRIG